MQFGIYSDVNGEPNTAIFRSASIAADSTGEKTVTCSVTLAAGVPVWLSLFSSHQITTSALLHPLLGYSASSGQVISLRVTNQTALPDVMPPTLTTGTQPPRIMLQVQ